MCLESSGLNVLGVKIAVRPGADEDRVREAAQMLEERYAEKLKARESRSREEILAVLALDLADELLRMKKMWAETEQRLHALLDTIEESI